MLWKQSIILIYDWKAFRRIFKKKVVPKMETTKYINLKGGLNSNFIIPLINGNKSYNIVNFLLPFVH